MNIKKCAACSAEKQPCFMCGAANVEAHHPDYDRALDVVWLCVPHHKEIHFSEA